MNEEFFKLSQREHFLSSRLEIVDVDLEKNPEILGELINNSVIKQNFKNKYFSENLFNDGASLIYPKMNSNCGLITILVKNENRNILASLHPFFNEIGLNYRGEISEVNVWESGVDAQICFDLDINEITFYDTSFLENREFYKSNTKFQARIYGVSYKASFLKDKKIETIVNEKYAEAFDKKVGEAMTWHTGSMSAFLPLDNSGGDIDEYEVCGKISSIRKLKLDFCDKFAYVCTIDCMRGFDDFYEFEIVITQENWSEKTPPQIDSYIHLRCFFMGEIII